MASFTAAPVYKWSYGYTWDVTFVTLVGDQPLLAAYTSDNWAGTNPVLKVDTVQNGVDPLSGTFRVSSGHDNNQCDRLNLHSFPYLNTVFLL